MPIIKHNPFRILGLTGNATEKELRKRISMLKRYAEVGKTKSFDYDFKFIGEFTRNSYEIQQASNSIEQAHKKLLYSLFWFIKNNPFDEIAFNNLKEGNTEKAIEIWNKTLKKEITSKNYSSYLNLSTLYIALSTIDDQIELQKLQDGILLKGNLIHSENLKDFSKLVTGNGIVNDSIEISKKFVDEVVVLLKPYTDKKNGISTNDLISLFKTFPFPISIQKYISAKFTEIPISNIDNKIEKTTRKRKDNPRDAEEYGEELYKSTESDITLLKKLMGSSNVQFQMIANKLANEILQCSIDFFNKHRDEGSKFDPGDDAMKIAKYAKSIGPTGQTKNRIDEAIVTLEDMRFRDAFQLISVLKGIIEVFEKVKKENSTMFGSRTYVDEEKVIETIRPIFTEQLVRKIASSNKDDLITDFNKTLNKVADFFSYRYSDFFENKRDVFISNLPITNSVKYNFEKLKLDNEISNLKSKLSNTSKKEYYSSELEKLCDSMRDIKNWKLFRGRKTKEREILEQKQKINKLIAKGKRKKKQEISILEKQIVVKQRELDKLTNNIKQ